MLSRGRGTDGDESSLRGRSWRAARSPAASPCRPRLAARRPAARRPATCGSPPAGPPPAGPPPAACGSLPAGPPPAACGSPPAGSPPAGQPPAGQPPAGQPPAGPPPAARGSLPSGQPPAACGSHAGSPPLAPLAGLRQPASLRLAARRWPPPRPRGSRPPTPSMRSQLHWARAWSEPWRSRTDSPQARGSPPADGHRRPPPLSLAWVRPAPDRRVAGPTAISLARVRLPTRRWPRTFSTATARERATDAIHCTGLGQG